MDAIKAEIERKKRQLGEVTAAAGGGGASLAEPDTKRKKKVYLRRGELERLEEELAAKKQATANGGTTGAAKQALQETNAAAAAQSAASSSAAAAATASASVTGGEAAADPNDELPGIQISEEELRARFRARGQPVRLFGETRGARIRRLRVLEAAEERTEGQRNDFQSLLQDAERGLALEALARRGASDTAGSATAAAADDTNAADGAANGGPAGSAEAAEAAAAAAGEADAAAISPRLLEAEPERCRQLISAYVRRLLREWESFLASRDEAERRSAQGRLQSATQAQSAEYLRPFFRGLKANSLMPDVVLRVAEICMFMQQREYIKANDSYLRLSIGNAPWPIGVTMVGIHERSAREKISSSQVAHALNDETQRKWIQSLKRLMTFAQKSSLTGLKYHERKLLKKADFLNWKSDPSLHEAKVMRRYHIPKREEYIKYNKLSGRVRQIASKLSLLDPRDPFRADRTAQLIEKLYQMGLIDAERSLSQCEKLS
ncbi:mRNA splicing protein prp18, partial [Cladochytrium tenue]